MILGTGIDLVHIPSFADQLGDGVSEFVRATFTSEEVAFSESAPSRRPAQHLAARFAAKEAAVKALDSACARIGIAPPAVSLRDIAIVRDSSGRPSLQFHGAASAVAASAGVDRVWVSMTHDADYAAATVTLERLA